MAERSDMPEYAPLPRYHLEPHSPPISLSCRSLVLGADLLGKSQRHWMLTLEAELMTAHVRSISLGELSPPFASINTPSMSLASMLSNLSRSRKL